MRIAIYSLKSNDVTKLHQNSKVYELIKNKNTIPYPQKSPVTAKIFCNNLKETMPWCSGDGAWGPDATLSHRCCSSLSPASSSEKSFKGQVSPCYSSSKTILSQSKNRHLNPQLSDIVVSITKMPIPMCSLTTYLGKEAKPVKSLPSLEFIYKEQLTSISS